ncbi:dihydrodipicolinate synthase family protein [Pelagibius sp.]
MFNASKRRSTWQGSFTAIVNPFTTDGELDEPALRANIDLAIEEGVHGLVICGHNGETHLMTDSERERAIAICVEQIAGRVPVLAGTGGISTPAVIARTRAAKNLGANGAMIEPPYFMTPKPADILAHFVSISDAVDLPVMFYNCPSRSGTDVKPDLFGELIERCNIVAIKDSAHSYDRTMVMIRDFGAEIGIFIGPAGIWGFAGIIMGGAGFVDGLQQVIGRPATTLFDLAVERNVEAAVPLQHRLHGLRTLLFNSPGTSPATIKDAMRLLGRPGGYPRLPLRPMQGADLRHFEEGLRALDIMPESAEKTKRLRQA